MAGKINFEEHMQKAQIQKLIAPYLLPQNNSHLLLFLDGGFIADINPKQDLTGISITVTKENKLCVTIAPNIILAAPIHLLFVTTQEGKNNEETYYNNKFIVETNSQIDIIEEHVILSDIKNCPATNVTTKLQTEHNAQIFYYKIFNAVQAKHDAKLQLNLGQASKITTHHLLLAAAEFSEKISAQLQEKQAVCENRGLYMLKDRQNVNVSIDLEHIATHCKSKVLFKGIAQDEARASFSGKILVKEKAQHSEARLDNKNLLLQNTARITTSPALEIYADDVKCSHGATVGQLNEEALWYLQSRGINLEVARQMLIQAFLQEIVYTLPQLVRTKVDQGRHAD